MCRIRRPLALTLAPAPPLRNVGPVHGSGRTSDTPDVPTPECGVSAESPDPRTRSLRRGLYRVGLCRVGLCRVGLCRVENPAADPGASDPAAPSTRPRRTQPRRVPSRAEYPAAPSTQPRREPSRGRSLAANPASPQTQPRGEPCRRKHRRRKPCASQDSPTSPGRYPRFVTAAGCARWRRGCLDRAGVHRPRSSARAGSPPAYRSALSR